MGLLRSLKELDRKFAWGFAGVLIAALLGLITVYREFIEDRRPKLHFDILTNTTVLDIKEEVEKLEILYDGVDIRKREQSLRVITVRVVNGSSKSILKTFYDEKDPFGLSLSDGKIIRKEIIETSNDYFRQNLRPAIKGDRCLTFQSVIIEANNFFVLKLLVLHPESLIPTITPVER